MEEEEGEPLLTGGGRNRNAARGPAANGEPAAAYGQPQKAGLEWDEHIIVVSAFGMLWLLFTAFYWACLTRQLYVLYAICLVIANVLNLTMWVFIYSRSTQQHPCPQGCCGMVCQERNYICHGLMGLWISLTLKDWKCPTAWFYLSLIATILAASSGPSDGNAQYYLLLVCQMSCTVSNVWYMLGLVPPVQRKIGACVTWIVCGCCPRLRPSCGAYDGPAADDDASPAPSPTAAASRRATPAHHGLAPPPPQMPRSSSGAPQQGAPLTGSTTSSIPTGQLMGQPGSPNRSYGGDGSGQWPPGATGHTQSPTWPPAQYGSVQPDPATARSPPPPPRAEQRVVSVPPEPFTDRRPAAPAPAPGLAHPSRPLTSSLASSGGSGIGAATV